MQKRQDLIIEIGVEELPPMFINQMVSVFNEQLIQQLNLKNLTFCKTNLFSTPRRITILVEQLSSQQPEELRIKKGPSLAVAYDANGKPTKALLGFMNSLKIDLHQLNIATDEHKKTSWVEYQEKKLGDLTINLLPEIIEAAIDNLPGPKMSWGAGEFVFARPVHWILALYGKNVVDCHLFGIQANNVTYGHRFIANKPITISEPLEYQPKLQKIGYVITDFNQRKKLIIDAIEQIEKELNAKCILDEKLLEQVTNMVEYPLVLCGEFDKCFLELPNECLISVLKNHQKSFALISNKRKLLPKFIFISNNTSKNNIISGNQKVVHARLKDAMFLYQQDLKTAIGYMFEKLKKVVLQEKLGNLYEQSLRIEYISDKVCKLLQGNLEQQFIAKLSGMFCKFDLVSNLVLEFPELQGIMAGHYLKLQQFNDETVIAVTEHYLPKFAEDILPSSLTGICVAIADRLNLLCGMFSIGVTPTGDKDPFGLRRTCLGIIRILIEKKLSLNILELFEITLSVYRKENNHTQLNLIAISDNLMNFTLERLKNWYIANIQNLNINFLYAVLNRKNNNLYDIDLRLKALIKFSSNLMFENLIASNKRIFNLLNKLTVSNNIIENLGSQKFLKKQQYIVDSQLLQAKEERDLYRKTLELEDAIKPLVNTQDYSMVLNNLALLVPLIDNFFENVMVVVHDQKLQNNRIFLLLQVKLLFSQVADFEKI